MVNNCSVGQSQLLRHASTPMQSNPAFGSSCIFFNFSICVNVIGIGYSVHDTGFNTVFGLFFVYLSSVSSYLNYICGKANKVLGLIRRTFGPNNPERVSIAYKTLVRQTLECAGLSGLESVLSEVHQ